MKHQKSLENVGFSAMSHTYGARPMAEGGAGPFPAAYQCEVPHRPFLTKPKWQSGLPALDGYGGDLEFDGFCVGGVLSA